MLKSFLSRGFNLKNNGPIQLHKDIQYMKETYTEYYKYSSNIFSFTYDVYEENLLEEFLDTIENTTNLNEKNQMLDLMVISNQSLITTVKILKKSLIMSIRSFCISAFLTILNLFI